MHRGDFPPLFHPISQTKFAFFRLFADSRLAQELPIPSSRDF